VAGLAFDEAASRLRTALELGIDDPEERADILLQLGDACHRAGEVLSALDAFRSAAEIARRLRHTQLLARAAIGYEEACWRPGIVDAAAADLLEEATVALGDEDSELRVGVLAGLARALDRQGNRERGVLARNTAVAMARRLNDRVGLATTLARSYWSRGTTSLEDILAMLSEGAILADELGNAELQVEVMAWRTPAFVALCDLEAARREAAALRETAERTAQPFYLHVAEHYRSAIALGDGRLDDAEAMAHRSHEWSRLLTGRDASGVYGIQMFGIRREQGRLAELAPVVRILAGQTREGPWQPGLVALLVELGMEAEARRELSRLVAGGLDPFRKSLWLGSLAYLTDACVALGDEAAAALVYPELRLYAGGNTMIGHLVACYGAADRYLGMLAATLGEWEMAQGHFERALELNRRMGASTWVAHTAFEYARCLLTQGSRDRSLVATLLGEATRLAERIGMPALLSRIRAVGVVRPDAGLPDGLSAREAQTLDLVARGLSNREIGSTPFISEHRAANHIRSILRKTGCANRTEAASYAHRHRLVST
jgi:DNA-binding CsgD family transcriptional regulator/tetratricopeptide (TPR) repeat protein